MAALDDVGDGTPPRSSASVSGPFGTRTANLIHVLRASSASTGVPLPGRVTVTWLRLLFGLTKSLITQGGRLKSASPSSRPWFGSLVLTSGGFGALQGTGAGSGPGPETLRTLSVKSWVSSRCAE